jgi:hypothetical protein
MQGGLTKREDLEGRLASGGWQLEAHWSGGVSLSVSEGVALSKIGGSDKADLVQEEKNGSRERESMMRWGRPGEQGQCGEFAVGEAGRARSMLGVHLDLIHSTKC